MKLLRAQQVDDEGLGATDRGSAERTAGDREHQQRWLRTHGEDRRHGDADRPVARIGGDDGDAGRVIPKGELELVRAETGSQPLTVQVVGPARDEVRVALQAGIRKLEQKIWDAADRETAGGLACDIGADGCTGSKTYHMNLVPITPEDETLRKQLLTKSILPKWIRRCGGECVTAWNQTLGPALGILAAAE